MKKGDISIEFIVLAALALIFLVVVAIVMTNKIGGFSKSVSSCVNSNGLCVPDENSCYAKGGNPSGFSCDNENDICCMNTCQGKGGICRKDSCSGGEEQAWLGSCQYEEICCIEVTS